MFLVRSHHSLKLVQTWKDGKCESVAVPDHKAQLEALRLLGKYVGLERREQPDRLGPLGDISAEELLPIEVDLDAEQAARSPHVGSVGTPDESVRPRLAAR